MRKMMTKEVTSTTVKIAKMEMVDGLPQAITLPNEVMLGNVSVERAQKEVTKKHGAGVTVFEVLPETTVYEMAVEDFIKLAVVKVEESPTEQE
jgi:hypothetical protein